MNSPYLQYQLAIHSWQQHMFAVQLIVPQHEAQLLTLSLPSWIPGSYMVRDFAKNIVEIEFTLADSGESVEFKKCDKQTWQVNSDGRALAVNYLVYANDLSVRSAFINHEYGFINGTSAFLQVQQMQDTPCKLTIAALSNTNWQVHTSMTPLSAERADNNWQYRCENYAEFIDHPLFIGECETYSFDVQGVTFDLLFSGHTGIDQARIARDLTPICAHHLELFGTPHPISRYLFMTLLADNGFGGLEHRNSTALLYPRYELPLVGEDSSHKSDGYIRFLSLCSHELFHTWHVKRIKPDVMVAPLLGEETYTNQLWIYEGFTSFYDDVTLARTGVIDADSYLDIVAQNITRLLQNAGRFKQSAAQSSFDAWTKFYKQDASATNNIVSYYTKGGIIAFGLDLLLRKQTDNQISLDNVMKVLWAQYGRDEVGTPDDVIESICREQFGIDISDYLNAVVYGTDDVPLTTWLADIGISIHTRSAVGADDKGGKTTANTIRHQLGANYKAAALGLTVTQVFEGLAAAKAGVMVNDTLLALNNEVVTPLKLQRLLDTATTPTVKVTLVRDGQLIDVDLPVIEARKDRAFFTIDDETKFNAWLGKAK